jgi:hypothetical protein
MFPLALVAARLQRTLTQLCLPADAYPMLNEIEKPQVWRKTRQPMRYKNRWSQLDVSWFLELEEKLGSFGKNHFMFPLARVAARLQRTLTRLCLPADAYPMLNEIEKPQAWRKTRQPMRYKNRWSQLDVSLFVELDEKLGLFGEIWIQL